MTSVRDLALHARGAARELARCSRAKKDEALRAVAAELRASAEVIARANAEDVERGRQAGLAEAMLDRLDLTGAALESTALGVEEVAALPDPVGRRSEMSLRPNGLLVARERVPLGVVAMVYESRPNVTVDAAALCLKSGNAVLLRGGKEAQRTNEVLGHRIQHALQQVGLNHAAVQVVPAGDRESVRELLGLTDLVDLVIPRGGKGLIRFVAEHARVPVIKHYEGVCHLYLDRGCDAQMALELTLNGKVQRPGVCNALECLLVHAEEASVLLPMIGSALRDAGVEVRGCARTCELWPGATPAEDSDWGQEFLAKILAVRVVEDLDAALDHVARYGSNHTEAICTDSYQHAQRWLREVDASCVLVNASTRFNDGGQLGLGAEIGISTSKLHAYGPMGLDSLTTEKWVVLGHGQVRA